MTEARGAVFVSHASDDSEAARRLCEALRAGGIEVWLDESELRGGDAWDGMIRARIRGCALFVALISCHTRARSEGYFRLEWKLAIDRSYHIASDRPFLLPIVIDETREADARVPDRFREVQWSYAPGGEAPAEFIERVRRMLDAAAGVSEAGAAGGAGEWSDSLPDKSLAVMPFANLSGDPENEYFSDGLAEEILNALGGVAGLRVSARSSSFYFKGRTADLKEIARRLRVAHLVEGSVRRVGSRVRVTAQLVDARNGFQLWSERYDRELADVFELQDEIARAIAGRLRVALLTGARRPTANMEAYELYLHGRHELNRRSPAAVRTSVQYFERCIALDPDYALAHAGLVACYGVLPWFGEPYSAAQARARAAAHRAMELGPELWECNFARALYSMYCEGDWGESERYYRRALEINARDPMLNVHYAGLHSVLGREAQAAQYVEAACREDPLAPLVHAMGSFALGNLAQYSAAEALARHALDLQPDHLFALWRFALALSGLGRHEEAVAVMEHRLALSRTANFTGLMGLVYGRAGRHEDAARLRAELETPHGDCPMVVARFLLELGSNDLERVRTAFAAVAAEGTYVYYHTKVACGAFIEPYRSDPEIDRLHRKLYGW